MAPPFENTTTIRVALASAFKLIKDFDQLLSERNKTSDLKKQMLHDSCCRQCAACATSFGAKSQPIAAHILALEDGGLTTRDNLVLLCGDCHTLFDLGYASRREMADCAAHWRNGRPQPIRHVMEGRRKSSRERHQSVRPAIERTDLLEGVGVYDLVQVGHYRKALRALQQISKGITDLQAQDLIRIVAAQIYRRRAARGVLPVARALLEKVDVKRLPDERLPLYYYEYGYVHQLEGMAKAAQRLFTESALRAERLDDEYSALESVIGRAQALAALVIQLPPRGADTQLVNRSLHAFDTEVERARALKGSFAGRWVLNCLVWKANLLLKAGQCADAKRGCTEAIEFRHGLDVTNGWVRVGGSTLCGIAGLTKVRGAETPDDVSEGLRFLARALVSVLSGNRRRPERVRDFLLAFEEGLVSVGRARTAKERARIADVRYNILDGSSFLDPYRARG